MTLFLALLTCISVALAAYDVLPWTLAAISGATFALVATWVRVVDAWLDFQPGWDELHMVTTKDGWTLPLYRYRNEHSHGAILLVHGIYSSMTLFDLGPDESLARHLQKKGYDVYCLELRDMGRAGRRSKRLRVSTEGATFDEYVREDLPAAVEHIVRVSGFSRIDYLGHSMGGMVYYPYGGTPHGQRHIRRAVTAGSLGGLPKRTWLRFLPIPWGLLVRIPHYGVREASRYLLAPLVGLGFLVESRFLNPRHLSRASRRRYFATGVANSPHTLLAHFGAMYLASAIKSRDGRDDYAALMAKNHVPTLVLAGTRDKIAPVPIVRLGFDALPGKKEWQVFEGFGHSDLLVGNGARSEIWPVIDTFLSAREQDEREPEHGAQRREA